MAEQKTFRHNLDGWDILCFIRKSRRSGKYRITYLGQSTFRITVPIHRRHPTPEAILHRHRRWLLNRLREEHRPAAADPFKLEDGARLPFLETTWTLRIKSGTARKTSWLSVPQDLTVHVYGEDSQCHANAVLSLIHI